MPSSLLSATSARSRALEASRIRAVAESALGRPDVIPLWFGEGAWPTNSAFVEAAVASLRAGNVSHPVGAGIVKEMFDAERRLQGWAVMVKTAADSDGGRGWFWYEVTSTTDGSNPVAGGNGVPLCVACHTAGQDFVLTEYPLR